MSIIMRRKTFGNAGLSLLCGRTKKWRFSNTMMPYIIQRRPCVRRVYRLSMCVYRLGGRKLFEYAASVCFFFESSF